MPAVKESLSAVTDVLSEGLTSFTELKSSIGGIDLTPVLTVVLPLALLVLGLMILSSVVQISVSTSRNLKSAGIFDMANDLWKNREEFGYSEFRSMNSNNIFEPVLNGIEMAFEKWGTHEE